MAVPREVIDLIERFTRNREAYRSHQYNETQARLELINPLFKALGWDLYNEASYAEAYKDIYGEDFPSETFRVLKEKETRLYGEYRTKRLVLEAWERSREV